jgi:DNA-binding beta-propeller fold protein YncE
LVLAGNRAYVADSSGGLRVVDISDPDTPAPVGNCPTRGDASAVAVAGDRAYVADRDGGLTVIDITDPASPVVAGNEETPGVANAVDVSGDFAYVADGADGLRVLEVHQRRYNAAHNVGRSLPLADTRDAVLRARLVATQSDSVTWSLSADGGEHWTPVAPDSTWHDLWAHPGSELVWRAELTYTGGIIVPTVTSLIVEWETATTGTDEAALPTRFALHQNTPNPFNPATRIRYDVPASGGRVLIAIYDVSGRLVRALVDRAVDPGERSVVWDGTDDQGARVASGVYFCRLSTPQHDETVRIALLK